MNRPYVIPVYAVRRETTNKFIHGKQQVLCPNFARRLVWFYKLTGINSAERLARDIMMQAPYIESNLMDWRCTIYKAGLWGKEIRVFKIAAWTFGDKHFHYYPACTLSGYSITDLNLKGVEMPTHEATR